MAMVSISQKPMIATTRRGSNVSSLGADKRNAKTHARLNAEYQAQQDREEKEREKREIERLFRLLDQGFITTGELKKIYKVHPLALGSRKYAILYEMWKAKKVLAARQKKKKSKSPTRRARTAPPHGRSETKSPESSLSSLCAYALRSSYPFTTSPCASSRLQCFSERPHTVHSDRSRMLHTPDDVTKNSHLLVMPMSTFPPQSFPREKSKRQVHPPWVSRYVHPIIAEMQSEESVDRLYDLATELLQNTHVSSKPERGNTTAT